MLLARQTNHDDVRPGRSTGAHVGDHEQRTVPATAARRAGVGSSASAAIR